MRLIVWRAFDAAGASTPVIKKYGEMFLAIEN